MRLIVGVAAMAAVVALGACKNRAANNNTAPTALGATNDSAASAAPASFTRDDLVGRWGAPTENCAFSTTFRPDDTFTDYLLDGSAGGSGTWSLKGDTITLVYADGKTVPDRIVEWKGDSFTHLVGDPPVRMVRRRCPPV